MTKDRWAKSPASAILLCAFCFLAPAVLYAAEGDQAKTVTDWTTGLAYICAALAVGLGCMSSAYAVARIGSAACGAVSEKPELSGITLVYLGLAEGIAIYGLIIAIMILNKL
ncbi:MAG: ATP synthase subunit C [Syntrophobacteraceae bacterium]